MNEKEMNEIQKLAFENAREDFFKDYANMKNFIFESYFFNVEKKELTLNYSFDSKMFFSEKKHFLLLYNDFNI